MAVATTTRISSTLAVVLLCAASLVATGAAGGHYSDLVANVCSAATRHHYRGPGLTRQFCESRLRSDRRSMTARDPRDLALVAMDLVHSSALDAGNKLDGVLRSGGATTARWSKYTTLRLHYCRQDDNDVVSLVPECRELVWEYNPRANNGRHNNSFNLSPSEYLECAGRLVHAADDCWVHMLHQDGEAKRAVWRDIVEVAGRANLAKAMVEQMVGTVDHDDDH